MKPGKEALLCQPLLSVLHTAYCDYRTELAHQPQMLCFVRVYDSMCIDAQFGPLSRYLVLLYGLTRPFTMALN